MSLAIITFLLPGGLSFSGASFSKDKGKTFQDMGFINPGSNFDNVLAGDPVVTCVPATGESTPVFYYTQIFATGPVNAPVAAIAINKSTNGGAAWGAPITMSWIPAIQRKQGPMYPRDHGRSN